MPEGLVITVDALSLHFDATYWINPNEFNPSRFSNDSKVNPMAYMPFGIGPRICIGFFTEKKEHV